MGRFGIYIFYITGVVIVIDFIDTTFKSLQSHSCFKNDDEMSHRSSGDEEDDNPVNKLQREKERRQANNARER